MEFHVLPSRYEEPTNISSPVDLAEFVKTLAHQKALEVWNRASPAIVLGADTIVAFSENDIGIPVGKPADREDARRMLRMLSGNWHSVYTGIALIVSKENGNGYAQYDHAEQTKVLFRPLNERQIEDYLDTGEPFDKAGAYGAQGFASPFIEKYDGDFYNVVGLPVCALGKLLEKAGIDWWNHRVTTESK